MQSLQVKAMNLSEKEKLHPTLEIKTQGIPPQVSSRVPVNQEKNNKFYFVIVS